MLYLALLANLPVGEGSKDFRIFFLIPRNDVLTLENKWAKEELDM